MRWRRPRFALVLTALIGLAALAVVVLGGGNAAEHGGGFGRVKSLPGGRARACLSTRAQGRISLHRTVRATARATAPLRVVQTVRGTRSQITVTRRARFTAKVGATRVVRITQESVGSGHACASARSRPAARGLAIRHAYAIARSNAHDQALAGARRGLSRLAKHVYPSLLAQARSEARRRAQAQAAAARPGLTAAAHRQAERLSRRG